MESSRCFISEKHGHLIGPLIWIPNDQEMAIGAWGEQEEGRLCLITVSESGEQYLRAFASCVKPAHFETILLSMTYHALGLN